MTHQQAIAANDPFDDDQSRANRIAARRHLRVSPSLVAAANAEDREIERLIEAARVKFGRGSPFYRQEVLSIQANGPTPAAYVRLGVPLASRLGSVL